MKIVDLQGMVIVHSNLEKVEEKIEIIQELKIVENDLNQEERMPDIMVNHQTLMEGNIMVVDFVANQVDHHMREDLDNI